MSRYQHAGVPPIQLAGRPIYTWRMSLVATGLPYKSDLSKTYNSPPVYCANTILPEYYAWAIQMSIL